MNRRAGFSLIEIIVVIAIIAILFVILLTQLGRVKQTAIISSVKEGLSTLRTEAQIQARSDVRGYANICDPSTRVGESLLRIAQLARPNISNALMQGGVACQANTVSYAIDVNQLLSEMQSTETYCVDATGYNGEGEVDTTAQFITCAH